MDNQQAAQTLLLLAVIAVGFVVVVVAARAGALGLWRFVRGNAGEVAAALTGGTLLGGLIALAMGATMEWALLIGVSAGIALTLVFVADV